MKRLLALLAAPAASFCLIGAAVPSAALATCYSSTQSNQTYSDSSADGDSGLAPEMIGAVAVTDSACGIGMAPALSNRPVGLLSSDVSAVYINADGNEGTGSSTFRGADKVVMTLGGYAPRVGTWNGSTFDFTAGPDLVENSDGGGFLATIDQIGIANPSTLGMIFATEWSGVYDNYFDFAPEPGSPAFSFPVAFSTTAPAPAPQPLTTVAPTTTTTPTTTAPTTAPTNTTAPAAPRSCMVPRVKNLAALSAAGKLNRAACKYRIKRVTSKVKKGRVVRSTPAAGRSTTGTVTLFVSKGKKHAHSASAAQYAAAETRMRAAAAFGLDR